MQKSNWKKYKLGDFCPFQYGKGLLSKNRVKGCFPVYGSNGINDWHNQPYVNTAGIIIGRKGTAGSVHLSKISFWPIDTTFFVPDEPQKRNLSFTYYLLKNTNLKNLVSDSAVPGLNRDAAHALELLVPPLEEQKRIAEVLGAFDDKIELLQKQNKTLEEMAKAIFKSWFVDFDIVKAKAELLKNSSNNNLSPLWGKCHEVAKGGINKEKSSLSATLAGEVAQSAEGGQKTNHQFYSKSVKSLVRAMRKHLTPQEVKLWQHIRKEQLGVKFRRQFPVDSKYIADFACLEKKLIIELDGSQHADSSLDVDRTLYLEETGFTVLRFWNNEIDKNLTGCLDRIIDFLNKTPLPARGGLSPQGGQIKTKEDIIREYHLTEELYDLFPSSFEQSPLGPIPTGWQVDKLINKCTIMLGGTPSRLKKEYWKNGTIPWIASGKVNDFRIATPSEYITQEGLNNSATKLMPKRTTVIAITGATLGQISLTEIKCCANQSVVSVLGDKDLFSEYIYFWIQYNINLLLSKQTGGAQQHINKNDVESLLVLVPSNNILKPYLHQVKPLFDKISNNIQQIQTLTELRDTLLPRLISGKIKV